MVHAYRRASASASITARRRPDQAVLNEIAMDAGYIVQTRLEEIYRVGIMDQAALDEALYRSAELAIVGKPLNTPEEQRIGFEEAIQAASFAAEIWFVDHPDAMRELRYSIEHRAIA